jgi:hypothetical protein
MSITNLSRAGVQSGAGKYSTATQATPIVITTTGSPTYSLVSRSGIFIRYVSIHIHRIVYNIRQQDCGM